MTDDRVTPIKTNAGLDYFREAAQKRSLNDYVISLKKKVQELQMELLYLEEKLESMTDKDKNYYTKALYAAIRHGDDDHQEWLYEAIYAFFHDQVVPPVKGLGNKEAKIKALEQIIQNRDELIQEYKNAINKLDL